MSSSLSRRQHKGLLATLQMPDCSLIEDKDVCVIIPDATRALPTEALLENTLRLLQAMKPRSITVLVALGLHRPMTTEELGSLPLSCKEYGATLRQHTPHDDTQLTSIHAALPFFDKEAPDAEDTFSAIVHESIAHAATIISIGTVEPHQYAGFSGGSKHIAIGCAGAKTITALHGLKLLRSPLTTLVETSKNPFRQALDRVARVLTDVEFTYNGRALYGVQLVPSKKAPKLFCGELFDAFDRAVEYARGELVDDTYASPLESVHIEVTGPKAVNFYQASRAATYVALAHPTILAPGATIFLSADCPEEFGDGPGEVACEAALRRGVEELLRELRGEVDEEEEGYVDMEPGGGTQRAYVLAKVLERFQLILIGAPKIRAIEEIGVMQFDTLEGASRALDITPEETIKDVFHRLPALSA